MSDFLKDLRFGCRMLLKLPGFTALAILTLALGIGATSAVFSLIQGVLLTPPPYREPDQLVLISSIRTDGDPALRRDDWAAAQWLEWQDESETFQALALYRWSFGFHVLDDGSEPLEGMWVSHNYFDVTGLAPELGRTFQESDAVEGAEPVIVLGHDLWQQAFHGADDIIGKTIRISRRETPPTIIGVMPRDVRFLPAPSMAQEPNYDVNAQVDYWTPVTIDPEWQDRQIWNVVGRLKREATIDQAQAELEVITTRQAEAEPKLEGTRPRMLALTTDMNRDGRKILLPLLGAAVLVLLISCGNAAALMLVRGLLRQQEYGVRIAMGARRAALLRQVTIESLVLALAGSAFGVALAVGIVKLFKLIGAHAIPRLDAVTAGWPVLLSGLTAAVLAAVLAGLIPAVRASRLDPVHALKMAGPKSSAGRAVRRLLSGVTMIQTALTLSLLVGAGLLIRTMVNLSHVQSGYNTEQVLTMSVTAVESDWSDFHTRALEQVTALPGVQHAAFAWGVPLTGNNWPGEVEIEGRVVDGANDQLSLPLRAVTPGYFELLGLEISQGRDFLSTDTGDQLGVAIINRAMAERYFADVEPLGKKIWLRGREQDPNQIVGVVDNARTDDLTRAAEPEIYLPLWQWRAYSKHLVVRTEADPEVMAGTIERELRSVEPTVAVTNVKTLNQLRSDSLASRTFAMRLLIGFALVASVLTLGGIVGVLSLSVASRRREIAIRTAVGAERRDIEGLVFGEGLQLIAAGVIAGLIAAVALSRVLSSFLFEIEPTDPLTLVGGGVLFAAVALLACWVPARRAAQVDTLTALREE